MTKFMIAVDGSNHSEKAYQIVNKLINDDEHDEIVFLSVISPMNHDNNDNNDNNEKDTTKVNRRKKKAEDLLCGWDKQAKDDGVTFLSFIYPSEVDRHDIDVLVLGTRGLGILKRMLLGSVSSYCVQHANCDVIVAK